MATKDKPAGLLSKMVQFIRQPVKKAPELDESDFGDSSEFAKKALKDRIKRKRTDDTIRRREFDYLRELRRSSPLSRRTTGSRPTELNRVSGPRPAQRANTIEKIDAIEAHMSQKWFERKPTVLQSPTPGPRLTPPGQPTDVAPQVPDELLPIDDNDYDFTKGNIPDPSDNAAPPAPIQAMDSPAADAAFADSGVSGFSNSKLVSVELTDSVGDTDLQDAALRFAEGDDSGAEAVLMAVVFSDESLPAAVDASAAALFDMYRSLGQKNRFEAAALDYAQRFGRSAPEWYSPSLSPSEIAVMPPTATQQDSGKQPGAWVCPATLDLASVHSLREVLPQLESPWHIDWTGLLAISPDAAPELETLFGQWCELDVKLRFDGLYALQRTLKFMTPSNDSRVDQVWWRLRLQALRMLQQHDEFEEAALDFCLVYELSPPSWSPARCELLGRPAAAEVMDSHWGRVTNFGVELSPVLTLELSGTVIGDEGEGLAALMQAPIGQTERLVVACGNLVRVDFAAASSVLNWVTDCESKGCRVQFTDVPRLVAEFFNVIGISDYAMLTFRNK